MSQGWPIFCFRTYIIVIPVTYALYLNLQSCSLFGSPKRPSMVFTFTFTYMHLAVAFIQSDSQCIQVIHYFVCMCVPWELTPQHFALLTQCSTTEPQEHRFSCFFIQITEYVVVDETLLRSGRCRSVGHGS